MNNQMKAFYPKKRKKAEQRKKSGKMVKKRKFSAKSGRGGNPDWNNRMNKYMNLFLLKHWNHIMKLNRIIIK
jgi:hypothetical protein